jgi:hypothetical protein
MVALWPAPLAFWGAMVWLVLAYTVFALFVQNYAAVRRAVARGATQLSGMGRRGVDSCVRDLGLPAVSRP